MKKLIFCGLVTACLPLCYRMGHADDCTAEVDQIRREKPGQESQFLKSAEALAQAQAISSMSYSSTGLKIDPLHASYICTGGHLASWSATLAVGNSYSHILYEVEFNPFTGQLGRHGLYESDGH